MGTGWVTWDLFKNESCVRKGHGFNNAQAVALTSLYIHTYIHMKMERKFQAIQISQHKA